MNVRVGENVYELYTLEGRERYLKDILERATKQFSENLETTVRREPYVHPGMCWMQIEFDPTIQGVFEISVEALLNKAKEQKIKNFFYFENRIYGMSACQGGAALCGHVNLFPKPRVTLSYMGVAESIK